MFVDYAIAENCKSMEYTYGEICVKCGKCGREFVGGRMIKKESNPIVIDNEGRKPGGCGKC